LTKIQFRLKYLYASLSIHSRAHCPSIFWRVLSVASAVTLLPLHLGGVLFSFFLPMTLPLLPGNPRDLFAQYRQAGGDPLLFGLYVGTVNGVHGLITTTPIEEGKKIHFQTLEVGYIHPDMQTCIESTARLVQGIIIP
jgi:hypothetical protein